jgi:hypothetical protein
VPVPARIVCDELMGAGIAQLDMAAEGSSAACADVTKCPQLRSGETALLAEELLFVLAKDIGDFEPNVGSLLIFALRQSLQRKRVERTRYSLHPFC